MPIMTRGETRILFSHIPKTAGSSLVVWFIANDWRVSNLIAGADGLARHVAENYGIKNFELEGEQPRNVAPQHAPRDVTIRWGDFFYEFAIVRHPISRYCSQVKYAARAHFAKTGERPSQERYEWFCDKYHDAVIEKMDDMPSLEDNHFRPQVDFIDDGFGVFKLESADWQGALASRFGLEGKPPQLNVSSSSHMGAIPLSQAKLNWILEFYEADFDQFSYDRETPT